jgi:mono/diheme cytochrome c family protein
LRLQAGNWIDEPAVVRGQWGQTMDDFGRLFTNSSEDYLRADLVSHHYPARNPHLVPPLRREGAVTTGVNYAVDSKQELWPSRITTGVNRGYWAGQLRKDGTLTAFTAACGPAVYRGDNFPAEFRGNYFSAEPCAHLVRRSLITEKEGILSGGNAYEGTEFLTSSDERFRPVNLYSAPDGTLYVVDMYRGIVQHREFMTTYLRRQIVERGLDKPIGYGRIYRIVHESGKPGPKPNVARASSAEWVENLSHPNGWWRDTAQRLLVERGDRSVAPGLRELATSSAEIRVRLHAAWTLDGLGAFDPDTALRLLADTSPKLRSAAVRLVEPRLAAGERRFIEQVIQRVDDPAREVRLQVALSLGKAPVSERLAALERLIREDGNAPFLVLAVISSVTGHELTFLERLANSPQWRERRDGAAALITQLAATVFRQGEDDKRERLLQRVQDNDEPRWRRLAVLDGIASSGVRKVARRPSALETVARSPDKEIAAPAADLLERFVWPRKFADGALPLTAAEQELVAHGRTVYERTCAACHQLNGRGVDGLALPLVDSKWVLGSDRILARIVLKGKTGHSAAAMPPLEMLSNRDLAGALSYVRRSWGHEAPPVNPATIGELRRAIIVRAQPYTDAELESLER